MQYRARRHPASMSVRLTAGGEDLLVDLMDVSEGGALVSLRGGTVPPDVPVTIHTARNRMNATIRWREGDHIGLRFDRDLSPSEVHEMAGKPTYRKDTSDRRWIYGAR